MYQNLNNSCFTDTVLLAIAESQSGQHRVHHLPVQEVAAQQAEARARGLRSGKWTLLGPSFGGQDGASKVLKNNTRKFS